MPTWKSEFEIIHEQNISLNHKIVICWLKMSQVYNEEFSQRFEDFWPLVHISSRTGGMGPWNFPFQEDDGFNPLKRSLSQKATKIEFCGWWWYHFWLQSLTESRKPAIMLQKKRREGLHDKEAFPRERWLIIGKSVMKIEWDSGGNWDWTHLQTKH